MASAVRVRVPAEHPLCRFLKDASVAELTVSIGDRWRQLQLAIDRAVVFRCAFGLNTGVEQLTALARTTRRELERRGWIEVIASEADDRMGPDT